MFVFHSYLNVVSVTGPNITHLLTNIASEWNHSQQSIGWLRYEGNDIHLLKSFIELAMEFIKRNINFIILNAVDEDTPTVCYPPII